MIEIRSLTGPFATAGVAGAAAAVLHLRDPHVRGSYGLCPFYELTGWWCPGCGGLRALHHLTDGHIVTALHSNVFMVMLVAALAGGWGRWTLLLLRGRPVATPRIPMPAAVIAIAGLTVFAVVRNTPWGQILTPV